MAGFFQDPVFKVGRRAPVVVVSLTVDIAAERQGAKRRLVPPLEQVDGGQRRRQEHRKTRDERDQKNGAADERSRMGQHAHTGLQNDKGNG